MIIAHTPVLLESTVQYLAPRKAGELMIDATQGEGGHSYAFLSRFPALSIAGVDADRNIQAIARERLQEFGDRVRFYNCWSQDFFTAYPQELKRPDTILIDLGVSMFHYECSGRGFSFRKGEPLDMRIDTGTGFPVSDLIARIGERDLADLLYYNAGERYSRRIARAIVEARSRGAIADSAALAEIVEQAAPAGYRRRKAHPAVKTFQALRIAANSELTRLRELLEGALRVLSPGGRLGVISFHSLEDREVKYFFREKNREYTCPPEAPIGKCKGFRVVTILTRKPAGPGEDELKSNPSSRSAKLRVVEKILDEEEKGKE
jgi:16S rRNA (cytosine1402-N4)-methyltransferase